MSAQLEQESSMIDLALMSMPGDELHSTLSTLKAKHGAVAEVRFMGLPAWVINDRDLLREAFRNESEFPPADIYRMFLEPLIGKTFQTMEGKAHRIYRQLATPSFKPSVLKHFDLAYLTDLGNELIDRFIHLDEVDLTTSFTHLFPFIVISRLLGISREKEADFQRWAVGILSFAQDPSNAEVCRDEMVTYLKPIIAERRCHPGEDVISALTKVEVEGHQMSDVEIMSTLHLMFSAGATTTHDAMGNLLYGLLSSNYWAQCVGNEPLQDSAVDEVLRWESPIAMLPRTTTTLNEIVIGGKTLPPGSIVLFALCAINRDHHFLQSPEQFKPGAHDYSQTLTFGQGYRMCPGMHLAKLQLKAMLSVLLDRLPQLQLSDPADARPQGSIMRGPQTLKVDFERAGK